MLGGFQARPLTRHLRKERQPSDRRAEDGGHPHQGAVFVLQLNADSLENDQVPLMDATQIIDEHTTITT